MHDLRVATIGGVRALVAVAGFVIATQIATHAGTWSTMLAGAGGVVVGMFLALALTATVRK